MPARSLRALCLTVDNLGEAAEVGAGRWDDRAPLGRHFTVDVVRRVLDLLARHGVPATFFVEAFNAELYPQLLREIADSGHEIACHGWQHEHWADLSPDRERELLTRSTRALRDLGLAPVGFRPPGGQASPRTQELLERLGYRYLSPAGSRAGVTDGLAVIPFEWRSVDAFYSAPSFAGLRAQHELATQALTADDLVAGMVAAMRVNAARGEPTTLVFHPPLLDDAQALAALDGVLAAASTHGDEPAIDCLTMRGFADRLLVTPAPPRAPVIDESTWVSSAAR